MKSINWKSHPELFTGAATPLVRMPASLMKFYSYSESAIIRAKSPSAVTMRFQSDTTKLAIAMQFGGFAREIFTTDIMIDDQLTTLDGAGPHQLELGSGKKNIVIHFPHLTTINALEIAVDADAAIQPVAPEKLLVICGDSILQGMTCSTPSKAVGVLTARNLGMTIHNLAVGGAIMDPFPVAEALKLNGAVTIAGFGINDAAVSTDEKLFRERVRQVLEHLSRAAGSTFILTPIPATIPPEDKREKYSAIIREEHRSFPQVNLIEGTNLLSASAENFADGLHPNDRGSRIYADNLTAAIKKVLSAV